MSSFDKWDDGESDDIVVTKENAIEILKVFKNLIIKQLEIKDDFTSLIDRTQWLKKQARRIKIKD